MLSCPKHKILFYAIPKTGTRSIYAFLQKNFGGKIIKDHRHTAPKEFKDYFSFTVIRNPYDRVCSQWWSTCKRNKDRYGYLAQFEKRGMENTVKNWLQIRKEERIDIRKIQGTQSIFIKNNNIDMFLKFETLQEDFNKLPFIKNTHKLEWLNPTINDRQRWTQILDYDDIKTINSLYAIDFETTDYRLIESYNEWMKLK